MSRLVLTRKTNETIVVHKNDDTLLTMKITKIEKNQVRIMFEASREIKIDREEILGLPTSLGGENESNLS